VLVAYNNFKCLVTSGTTDRLQFFNKCLRRTINIHWLAKIATKSYWKLEHQRRLITTRAPLHSHSQTCPPFRPKDDALKISYDISNGSGVIMLTDKQTDIQTDTIENNTTFTVQVVKTGQELMLDQLRSKRKWQELIIALLNKVPVLQWTWTIDAASLRNMETKHVEKNLKQHVTAAQYRTLDFKDFQNGFKIPIDFHDFHDLYTPCNSEVWLES